MGQTSIDISLWEEQGKLSKTMTQVLISNIVPKHFLPTKNKKLPHIKMVMSFAAQKHGTKTELSVKEVNTQGLLNV
jgi:hypothetical protein